MFAHSETCSWSYKKVCTYFKKWYCNVEINLHIKNPNRLKKCSCDLCSVVLSANVILKRVCMFKIIVLNFYKCSQNWINVLIILISYSCSY